MSEQADPCTCKNRTLRPEGAVFWIRPNNTGWITARDCPLHGVVVNDSSEPVNHPSESGVDEPN
jgi:hypothetical protein